MKRIIASFLAIAIAAFGLSMASADAVAGPCDSSAESTKITVMADWLPWASQGPMMAAQLGGYYKDEGLEVEIIAPRQPRRPDQASCAGKSHFQPDLCSGGHARARNRNSGDLCCRLHEGSRIRPLLSVRFAGK